MSTAIALHATVADALAAQLPTPTPLRATPSTSTTVPGDLAASAVVASFVGGVSADLALVLIDLDAVMAAAGTDSPLVSVTDVLRPAFESGADALGTGVLGDSRIENAAALFADTESVVFELTAAGVPAGWCAIRLRENGTVRSAPSIDARSTSNKLGRINNVEMALTVEIGRTRMSVRDVLGLEPGAVIELDRSAGAPADVLLNGRLIAHGEVVVVDQDYAVRITRILDIAEGVG
ncbi:flagellar motor switch protein FliN [Planctomonas psychrotolerans]|uniref:flagellar motor switch protein FliN n=1 Tax=Planctomonas psychrotolerans TaxID=2528712 RepID=UPI0012388627|nr:flagellar motor switch protein FliN [Planctomonas psychrotolerans]